LAKSNSRGAIVIKTDCDSITLDNEAIDKLVSNFRDERVGAATGFLESRDLTEKYFRLLMKRLQIAESNIDSAVIAHGSSFLAFRKDDMIALDRSAIADDTEEFIRIRKNGKRTIIDATVMSEEEVPSKLRDRRIWKNRRGRAVVQALGRNVDVLFRSRYGSYGLVIFPIEFFLVIVSPVVALLAGLVILYRIYTINSLFLLLLAACAVIFAATKRNLIVALLDLQLSGLVGGLQILVGRDILHWERTRSE
jgi:cellulose synthase/poly-beta-1,6-N-acetylglucosamine synthase-like glycosyltransferase